ncbi:MAG: Hsp70 family protein [Deltaproteobacteria bacterium]|nr:Hsp70 family protein [Deltaproteobacteria bacterium]
MKKIIGIDLGTTNSEVAVMIDDRPVILEVDGEKMMPSCVGIDADGKLLVGRAAKNQMVLRPESTILAVKRLMGQETRVLAGGREFSPEEVSALILKRLKEAAEDFLGESVDEAVITVPAFFNDQQRKATKKAGELAGLKVQRIINEPTAAALAYGNDEGKAENVLIYDLGGGTFDVSLVTIENGVIEVRASHGDTHLGGNDFDERLLDYLAAWFEEEQGLDPRRERQAHNRLLQAAEEAKIKLSEQPYAAIREEFICADRHLEYELERHLFESLIEDLLNKTMDCIAVSLQDAAFMPTAIDRIILVGGSSRCPLVRKLLEERFLRVPIHDEVDPDLIVALGAALQGGIIAGQGPGRVLVDITPHTFGTAALGNYMGEYRPGIFIPVIHRNTHLPARKSEVFYTSCHNQEEIKVEIYQGDNPLAEDNLPVGSFFVENLTPAFEGSPIVLQLQLDLNGILEVTATEKQTGKSKSVRMQTGAHCADANPAGGSAADGGQKITETSADGRESGGQDNEKTAAHKALIARARDLRQRAEKLLDRVEAEDAAEIKELLQQIRLALSDGNEPELEDKCGSLDDILFYLED